MRSRKRILDITSVKKRDTMAIEAKDDDPTLPTDLGEPLTLAGETPFLTLFCPTARSSTRTETEYSRNRTTTFGVGYSERVELHTNNGGQWIWRRIAFSMKGPALHSLFPQNTLFSYGAGPPDTGYTRPMWNLLGSSGLSTAPREATEDLLFAGEAGKDWFNRLHAKTDNTRVSVHMDVTRHIRGGNDEARRHTYKDWIPIRKNVVYDEEESGDVKTFGSFSVNSKVGFGDLYIYDYWLCNTPDDEYRMDVECQGVYYWRER